MRKEAKHTHTHTVSTPYIPKMHHHPKTTTTATKLRPLFLCFFLTLASSAPPMLPSDAVSLLSFKRLADQDNKLLYSLNERYDYCEWQGVKCAQGRVVSFVAQSMGLRGPFPPHTLTSLDQLRVLSLRNNSLFGPIPDLSPLVNLKSFFLDHSMKCYLYFELCSFINGHFSPLFHRFFYS